MEQYELYCLAKGPFYETPTNRGEEDPDFTTCARPVPDGWERHSGDVWANYAPVGFSLPPQGSKIHVSSRLADADRTLAAVWEYCIPRGIASKFLRNEPGCRPARRGDSTVDPRARLACASIRWRAGLPGQPTAPALDGSRHRLGGRPALGVALHDQPPHLPFFDAARPGRSEQIHGEPGKGPSEPDKVWKEV